MSSASVVRVRFPGIALKVFLFLFGAVLGTAVLFGAVAYKQGLFTPHIRILFYTDNASGINRGMSVELRGFRVGSVQDMRMKGDQVEVELSIIADYAQHIPPVSRARVSRDGFIGARYIEIVSRRGASLMAPGVADDDVILFDPSTTLADVADELRREVQPMVTAVRESAHWLNEPDGEVRQALVETRKILEASARTQAQINVFLDEASATVGAVRESMGPVRDTLTESLRASGKTVAEELPKIAATTSSALGEVAAAARELSRAARATGEKLGGTAERVSGAVREVQAITMDAGEIAAAAKHTWPFSRMLESPRMRTLPIDINASGFPLPPPTPGEAAPAGTR